MKTYHGNSLQGITIYCGLWFSLREQIKHIHALFMKAKSTNSDRKMTRQTQKEVRHAKTKDDIGEAGLRHNRTLHRDSKTKAELLNNQFGSVEKIAAS